METRGVRVRFSSPRMRTGTGGRYSNATDGTWCAYANVSPCRTACSRTRWPTGGTVTPECLRRTAAWLTDVAGELDRMRTLLELDLDRRTGRSRPDPAKDAREASKRGPDGENTAEPARQTLRQYVHCE